MKESKIVHLKEVKELTRFFTAIREDSRVGVCHISLYMALFQLYNLNQFQNPVDITRAGVMEVAKISGKATYHKCIKDLAAFGYIRYLPSYNPSANSQVYILTIMGNGREQLQPAE